MKRYLSATIDEFTQRKFVFLAGPRQVGKTTLSKAWLSGTNGLYLNWDVAEDREYLLKKKYLADTHISALIFDEIHKYPRWRNYIKGLYDKEANRYQVIVTGSAKLDLYRKGGDSLFGRYELLRLHPLTIGEVTHGTLKTPPEDWLAHSNKTIADPALWTRLSQFGGFPEPYTLQDPLQYNRWSLRRRELLIKEDLRDLSEVKLVDLVEHLYLLLPERVGSPLSLNSLKEELQVAFNTVSSWISILERLYICYRISPYFGKIARSLRKEQKLYLWDWSQIQDPASRFENQVANHLLKSVHAWNDLGYGEYNLNYWRNKEKEEVDFVITKNRKPVALFECKLSDTNVSRPLSELSAQLGNIPAIQLVDEAGCDYSKNQIRVVTAKDYLVGLN